MSGGIESDRPPVTIEQDVTLCFTCSIEWHTLELGAIHTARNRRPRDRNVFKMLVAQCVLRFLRTPEASGGAASGSGGGGGESTPS